MKVTPILDYKLLGTMDALKAGRIYDAEPATNQPYWEEKGKVFVEGVLLRHGEYIVMEEQGGIGAAESYALLQEIGGHLDGTIQTGRWLDPAGTQCDSDEEGAAWHEYDDEEQRLWLYTLVGMMERMRDYINKHTSAKELGQIRTLTEQRDEARMHVKELHAAIGQCLTRHKRVRLAAAAVIDRWESPLWKDTEPTGAFIADLGRALNDEKPVEIPNIE